MAFKFSETFDLRLIIQIATIVISVVVVAVTTSAKLNSHVASEAIHKDYEDNTELFVPRETVEQEFRHLEAAIRDIKTSIEDDIKEIKDRLPPK